MKNNVPPVLSPLDFAGLESKLILIQLTEWDDLLNCLPDQPTIIFTPHADDVLQHDGKFLKGEHIAAWEVDTIYAACSKIRKRTLVDGIKINFVIHRIDLLDTDETPRERGRLRKGFLSWMTPKILQGSNIFITSVFEESETLRSLVDKRYDLTGPSKG